MGTPGYRRIEAGASMIDGYMDTPPLTLKELLALPADTVVCIHTHLSQGDIFAKRVNTALRLHRPISFPHHRTGDLTDRGLLIEPTLHDGQTGAMNYRVTIKGEPYCPRPTQRKVEGHGGRRRTETPSIIPWLKDGKRSPASTLPKRTISRSKSWK